MTRESKIGGNKMENNNYCSKKTILRICEIVAVLIIIATIGVMIAIWFIFSNMSFSNRDIVFVATEACILFVGYQLLMTFVKWCARKRIL